PVLYVVADNGFAISVPASEQSPAPVAELVRGFRGLAIHRFDGRDYFTARRRGAEAIARVRASEGPALIHATVTRPYSHSAADTQTKYRSTSELADETAHDPITLLEAALVEGGVLSPDQATALREEAFQIVADAAKQALASPRPDPVTITDHVKALPQLTERAYDPSTEGGHPVAFGEAIKLTLH